MGLEIDFLSVGDNSKGGDAIAWRFGDLTGARKNQLVVVVDGGTKDSGERLVDHILNRFKTDYVDIVVSTHPDADHISGLTKVVEGLGVGEIWMNRPWRVKGQAKASFIDEGGLIANERVKNAIRGAATFEDLAVENNIPIHDAFFTGEITRDYGMYSLSIIGPTREYYSQLVEQMEAQEVEAVAAMTPLMEALQFGGRCVTKALESFDVETLKDPAENGTSPSNNSSVILLIRSPDGDALLTADAGVSALTRAFGHASELGVDLAQCKFQQVPHHGSRRNMGPTLLDSLIGEKGSDRAGIVTCISAPKEGRPKHPNVRVTNAYLRRGASVYSTEGKNFWHHLGDAPGRSDYTTATPLEFVDGETEDDD